MGYLFLSIISLLFPYTMHLMDVKFDSEVGILGSLATKNTYSLAFAESDVKKELVLSQTDLATYRTPGILTDFFVDYNIWVGRLLVGARFGIDPFATGITYKYYKIGSNSRGTMEELDYFKGGYGAIKLGLNVRQRNPDKKNIFGVGITPYFLGGVEQVFFESTAYFNTFTLNRYRPFWGLGAEFDYNGRWNVFAQIKNIQFNTLGSHIARTLSVNERQFQVGVAYKLFSTNEDLTYKRANTYNSLISKINNGESSEESPNADLFNKSNGLREQNKVVMKEAPTPKVTKPVPEYDTVNSFEFDF